MRNLTLINEKRHKIQIASNYDQATNDRWIHFIRNPLIEESIVSFVQDEISAIYLYALISTGEVIAINTSGSIHWKTDLTNLNDSNMAKNFVESQSWFSLTYVDTSSQLVALSHDGCIANIDCLDGKTEIVGSFDFGLITGSWSLDTELLCLVTDQSIIGSDKDTTATREFLSPIVIIMNCEFEILAEATLPTSRLSEPIFVTWKSADNSMIAISSVDQDDGIRRIRIFDVTTLSNSVLARAEDGSGKLLSNIFPCPIAWAGPNCSSLIAAVQKRGRHGLEVVFIESNGLQHGNFKLRTNEGDQVVSINWNSDSDLLAAVIVNVCSSDFSRRYRCQLYHRSNYHWYIKREFQYDNTLYPATIEFDRLKKMSLLASIKHRGSDELYEFREYDFTWNFSVSDNGTVAVIDGSTLSITHMNKAVIPPPLCAYSLWFKEAISEVKFISSFTWQGPRFASSTTKLNAIASSCEGSLLFLGSLKRRCGDNMIGDGTLSILTVYEWSDDMFMKSHSSCLRQFTVFDVVYADNEIMVKLIALATATSCSELWQPCDELYVMTFRIDLCLQEANTTPVFKAYLDQLQRQQLPGQGIGLSTWTNYNPVACTDEEFEFNVSSALVQLSDGCLYEYFLQSGDVVSLIPISESELMFLEPCPIFSGLRSNNGKRILLGMSQRSRLYMGERLIQEAVSWFHLSPAHRLLAFSTIGSRSQLYLIPIDALLDFDPLSSLEDSSLEGYGCRDLERGSVLFSVFPDRPEAIFLLPRGNIELLCPRGLLIPYVVRLLCEEKYAEAFSIMRRQKIDVNLLCDVNPLMFLKHGGIEKFLEQVKSVDHINLFIAGLSNADVTATKYTLMDWFGPKPKGFDSPFDFSTKINQICSKMRSVMITAHECGRLNSRRITHGELLLPILSTYAKEEPPQLERALLLIQCGDDLLNHDTQKGKSFNDKLQSAITYLAFLSNYELLFDTALGIYDFEMAKAVARNSQLDPKQYLPLLKHYEELPKYRARFEVDLRLKRYDSALRHMALDHEEMSKKGIEDDNFFTECLDFIEKYKLHRLAFELFVDDHTKKREVMLSLGRLMLSEGKYESALSIFLSTDPIEYTSVLKAARMGHDWQTYFTFHKIMTTELCNERHLEVKDLALSIAKEISEATLDNQRSAYAEAARILLDYGDDTYNAIGFLISGELWLEARRLCVFHGLENLCMKVKDEAHMTAENYIIELEGKGDEFEKAVEKFVIAKNIRRESKRNAINRHLESGVQDDTGSLFSVASQTSNMSVRSNTSNFSRSSMSSVISAGHTSSFSIIESRSVVNPPKTGNKKGRKSKSKAEKRKIAAGSDDDLINIMKMIKACITDDLYATVIVETLTFLLQERLSNLAADLFQAYMTLQLRVNDCIKSSLHHQNYVEENRDLDPIIASYETEIRALKCADLPQHFKETFIYLSNFG